MPAPCTLTVRQAAESRRTVRRYIQQDVPEEDLRELLRQTRLAPSPDNIQPWRFIAIRDPGVRAQMLPLANHQPECVSAHALIVLYADMEDVLANLDEIIHPGLAEPDRARIKGNLAERFGPLSVADRQRFAHGIAYIALGYLVLAAQAMGYRTSSILDFDPAGVKELLGLPEHVTVPALITIGKEDEPGYPHHRHSVERIALFV
jgi:nitroreductase